MAKGKMIVAFGIPGCGKSSVTREVGKHLNIQTYHEPEEEDWAENVQMRDICGHFTTLMWFRAVRVPQLFKALDLNTNGQHCMVDSYYDKLFYLYHNKKGIEWLIDDQDLYYNETVGIAKKDYEHLPNADIVVFFKLDEATWLQFLKIRNRQLDHNADFTKSFILQKSYLEAAQKYCADFGKELIVHQQRLTSPQQAAEEVATKIRKLL